MKIKEINNHLILKIINHEKVAPKKQAYFLDIINTLNPANKLYKSNSKASKAGRINHNIDIELTYKFQNTFSATLFALIFKHLVLKDQFLLEIKNTKNEVLIKTKNSIVLQHREKFSTEERTIKSMERSFAHREETYFISEIFINTVQTIFFSNLYQNVEKNKKLFNKEIIVQLKRSAEDRVDYQNLKLLINNIFEFTNEKKEKIVEKNWIEEFVQQVSDYFFKIEEKEQPDIESFDNKYIK